MRPFFLGLSCFGVGLLWSGTAWIEKSNNFIGGAGVAVVVVVVVIVVVAVVFVVLRCTNDAAALSLPSSPG